MRRASDVGTSDVSVSDVKGTNLVQVSSGRDTGVHDI